MKILHIINSLGTGGAEKLLVDTLPLYLEKGVKVELLLLNGTKTPFFEQLEKTPGLNIYHLGYLSLFNPILIFRIIPFLKKDYDIIHVHLFPALYWTALAKTLSRSKPALVFTKHSTSNRRMELSRFTKVIEKWILRKYAKIITISPETDFHLKKHLQFPSGRFSLIENGIDLAKISKAPPSTELFEAKDKDQKIIIQVSSFRIPKDQKTLLKALALLPENTRLLLVGDGPQRGECEKLAKELHIENRTKFLGARTDIPQLLKVADVVVLSTGYEGFGLAVVEGMAAGKPVIASDVPGVRGVVKNAGILFPKGDEKKLAKHITDLTTDPDHYNKTANACFEQSKNYDINMMTQKHISLYEKIIKA